MKSLFFKTLVVLSLCFVFAVTEATVQIRQDEVLITPYRISRDEFCSVHFNKFLIKVYEDINNKRDSDNNIYFYEPLVELNLTSVETFFNNASNKFELRFRI